MHYAVALLACCLTLVSTKVVAFSIVDPNDTIEGQTIGQWTGDWWRWFFSQTEAENTFQSSVVPTGKDNPAAKQTGPVWFVYGSLDGTVERTFEVPKDSYILFPAINFLSTRFSDFPGVPEDDASLPGLLADQAAMFAEEAENLFFEINGVSVTALPGSPISNIAADTRHVSPLITDIVVPPDNALGIPEEETGPGIADGYWLMIELLKGESITVAYGGESTLAPLVFGQDNVANITAVPVPAALSLFGFGVAFMAYCCRKSKVAQAT